MVRNSRFFLFSTALILGFFLILGFISYKVNIFDLEAETRDRLTQIRNFKEAEIKADFRLLNNALLDNSDKFLVKEFAQNSALDEMQITQWLKAHGGEQNWKALVYHERKVSRPTDINRIIGQMSPYAAFLQAYYMQNQKSREAFSGKFAYFQRHEKVHPQLRNLASRLHIDDIFIIDARGIVFYTVKKDILLGTNLNVGIFSGSRLAQAYKWAKTASPESINFFDFSESNLFTNASVGFLATPIFIDSNRVGTIVFQIPASRIDEILSNNQDWRGLGLRDTGEVVVFGPEGLMRNYSRDYLQGLFKQKDTLQGRSPETVNAGLSKKDIRNFQSSDETFLKIKDYADQETFASIGKVELPGNVTWLLMAKINASEIFALAHRRILPLAVFCICLLFIGIGVAYFLALRFNRPLRIFNTEIENILEQRPSGYLPQQRGEFQELGKNLQDLFSKLQKTDSEMLFWKRTMNVAPESMFLVEPLDYKSATHQGLKIFDLNTSAAMLLALSPDALRNSDLKMWVEADYDQISENLHTPPLAPFKLEGLVKRSSGQKIPIELHWQPLWPNDPTSFFIVVTHETQERKESLNKIRLLEGLLNESQSLSRTGSFRWDIKAGRLDCTTEKLKILGLDSKDSYPSYESFRALILSEDMPVFEKNLHESIKNISPVRVEYRIRRNDSGETVWLRTLGRTEYDNYGNAVCMYGVTQEITEERRQEQALISAKNEAGEVSIENIPFDFNKLMSDVEQIMGPKAEEKGLNFSYDIAPNISPLLMGDPNKLRQILINLVSNSLKFTASGAIRASVAKNPSKKDSLLISVNDTGIGIPENKQHLIFQKFSQADSSVARKYGGTGLGLAISKSLVELMGGQIWFKSRENIGTTFFLSIPYREQASYQGLTKTLDTAENEVDFIGPKPRAADKKIKILIVDDTEDNRTLFTHYLKNGPYEIIEAENGLEAVDKIKSEQFDIVFMDVQMPEMDGYTATGQIRAWENNVHKGHLPIIALTAHALSEDRQKSLRAGCDEHIAKPFKKDTLLGVINRYLL